MLVLIVGSFLLERDVLDRRELERGGASGGAVGRLEDEEAPDESEFVLAAY